jgi:CRISPR-associated protein Csy1
MSEINERAKIFRAAIASFIETRREAKLKGKEDDATTASKYEYETWLADTARRVEQIQAVTHVLKATHPDARGSSLHLAPAALFDHTAIGSHQLGVDFAEDVVGNAAALDVLKFLKIEVDGRRLLDWMQVGDDDLNAALSEDPALASRWMHAFAGLVRNEARFVSHPLAKQIYWLTGGHPQYDDQYQLLQPMFSSSLAHVVHAEIQDARFGEANKAARQAFRDSSPCASGYRDYRNLAIRKLGGTKPQNISQLNSERGGVNYLLPSLPPPPWQASPGSLLKRDTAIDEFTFFEDVRKQVKVLAEYLLSVQEKASTVEVRERRDRYVENLAEMFALFGADARARYPAGWTRHENCRLPWCEQLWLDPDRVDLPDRDDPAHPEWSEDDQSFKQDYHWGDWPDQIAARFGNWLNARLRDAGLVTVSLSEHTHWARKVVLDVAWPVPLQRNATRGAA